MPLLHLGSCHSPLRLDSGGIISNFPPPSPYISPFYPLTLALLHAHVLPPTPTFSSCSPSPSLPSLSVSPITSPASNSSVLPPFHHSQVFSPLCTNVRDVLLNFSFHKFICSTHKHTHTAFSFIQWPQRTRNSKERFNRRTTETAPLVRVERNTSDTAATGAAATGAAAAAAAAAMSRPSPEGICSPLPSIDEDIYMSRKLSFVNQVSPF
ncbi:hypothetical protein IWZ03DRAFT_148132 [Phyllosticta citriasiana]|uniref:Uncharacterized protein n=1 Tax=Phyllosticta citriasiana TaxID=595635 RepID=A0ABR1KNK3_9PEZI